MKFSLYQLRNKCECGLAKITELLRETVEILPTFINGVRTPTAFATCMAFAFLFYSIYNLGIESGLSGFFCRTCIVKKLALRVTD
jgi:hypothetical protein